MIRTSLHNKVCPMPYLIMHYQMPEQATLEDEVRTIRHRYLTEPANVLVMLLLFAYNHAVTRLDYSQSWTRL